MVGSADIAVEDDVDIAFVDCAIDVNVDCDADGFDVFIIDDVVLLCVVRVDDADDPQMHSTFHDDDDDDDDV